NKCLLERYNAALDTFEVIDEAPVGMDNFVQFFDANVDVQRNSYTYRIAMVDTCDQILDYSNIGKTILAEVITQDTEMRHTIQWTPYAEFEGDVVRYDIYRTINGVMDTQPIVSLTPDRRSYTDDVADFFEVSDGKFCYQVVAVEANNTYGFSEWSRSNLVCPIVQPVIYIPNAFSVGGLNPVFKPVTSLHRMQDYEFVIMDRMGRTIFQTKDPSEGWTGVIAGTGNIAREGVYVYRLSLRDGNGIQVVRNGHVTLLNYND
ncbi:MAG: gliding motility-associated C-terminal domain-containing protein, partial [Crocinitomicaceae bacterium]|nr:gliding motility-associated C-terminal domain-containing protein [Crocinitomicaceae bacterium]